MFQQFKNRQDAGNQLAQALKGYTGKDNVLLLALPRGGVPVAYEMAHKLSLPLDVLLVRKLGVPAHPIADTHNFSLTTQRNNLLLFNRLSYIIN